MSTPSSYRTLLRVVRDTFKGDSLALRKCRAEARAQFRANAGERDSGRIARMVADALDAAQFLRESVVQAQLNAQGNYAMQLKPQPGGGGGIAVQPAQGVPEGGAQAEGAGCGKPGGCGCS
jgi:complex III assembly factor LYRM7